MSAVGRPAVATLGPAVAEAAPTLGPAVAEAAPVRADGTSPPASRAATTRTEQI
jgi:hypothetical protein